MRLNIILEKKMNQNHPMRLCLLMLRPAKTRNKNKKVRSVSTCGKAKKRRKTEKYTKFESMLKKDVIKFQLELKTEFG